MEELELRDYLRIGWKRKWLILGAIAVCVGAAVALTARATPIYEASGKLFVGQSQVTTAELQEGVQVSQLSLQLLQTYAEVIRTTPIIDGAIRSSGLPANSSQLAARLRAEPIVDTQLLRVSYRDRDAALAQRTVNAVARAFVDEIQKIEGQPTEGGEPAIKVSIVQPALRPGAPVSPQPARNIALALFLGVMLGVGAAFVTEYLDTTIKHKEDIEERLGMPVLAGVPKIRTRVDELYLEGDNQSAFAETFRKLRTAIQLYGGEAPIQTILVSSPFSGDGKTTTALNLAAVYAYAGNQTILVEADLRRPALHRIFPGQELNGLTLALLGRTSLSNAIIETDVPNLYCIPAAAIPPNPVEILASERMQSIIDELKQRFHTIIIDAPPLLPVADASTIVPRVDGTLIVARTKETRRDRLRETVQLVEKSRGRVLGVVMNAVSLDESGGYAYQYYTYSSSR